MKHKRRGPKVDGECLPCACDSMILEKKPPLPSNGETEGDMTREVLVVSAS